MLATIALVVEITRRQTRLRGEHLNLRFQERAEERERIASQIHDTVIQDMVGSTLQLELLSYQIGDQPQVAARSLRALATRMRETIARTRNMASNLHSTAVPQCSLIDVLRQAEAEFRLADLPKFRLKSEGEPRQIHLLVRDEIYRICREALASAFRHSDAQQIEVQIRFEPKILHVDVIDDGQGMDEETKTRGRPRHFGLLGMEAHARRIGAEITIESEAGKGTHIHLRVRTPSRKWNWSWHEGRAQESEPVDDI